MKWAGSEGIKELGLGPPDQAVAYSNGGAEKGTAGGGGSGGGVVDEWESEGEWTSGEEFPKIAERMEYSRLTASDPKGKDDASRDVLNRASVGVKTFMAVNELVRRGMRRRLWNYAYPKGPLGSALGFEPAGMCRW
jgi:hypothetical protein